MKTPSKNNLSHKAIVKMVDEVHIELAKVTKTAKSLEERLERLESRTFTYNPRNR